MDHVNWEDEGGSYFDEDEADDFYVDEQPYCLCGYPCDECPEDCEDCDCDEQYSSHEF